MARPEGSRDPKTRQRRERLSISRPCVELALGSLAIDGYDVAETRQFGNRLAADAERWMLRCGFGERGRISKLDAELMWRETFPAQRLNSLAKYRRAGAK